MEVNGKMKTNLTKQLKTRRNKSLKMKIGVKETGSFSFYLELALDNFYYHSFKMTVLKIFAQVQLVINNKILYLKGQPQCIFKEWE